MTRVPSEPRWGVNVAGYFRAEVGVGEAARSLVAALKAAQIPYALIPFAQVPSRQRSRFDDWGERDAAYGTNIICVNAASLQTFVDEFGSEFFEGRHNIGFWWWEVEEFPHDMRAAADMLDEIWVGSRHAYDSIAPVVSKPVLILPPPIVQPSPADISRSELGIPDGFTFLFTFDFNSVLERKNPYGAIDAFGRAFAPGDGAVLVVKSVNGYQHPRLVERLRAATAARPDIVFIDEYLDLHVLHGLVADCDAYVSLHRAEGFGIGLAEAMALGKPVIATAYGGNLEFMTVQNSYLVRYEMTEISSGCEPYPARARWADPDLDEAAKLLRDVYEDPEAARARGAQARIDIAERHSPEARAPLVRRRLETVARPQHNATQRAPLESGARTGDSDADLALQVQTHGDLRTLTTSGERGRGVVSITRRILYRLLFPIIHRQAEYNLASARVLASVREEVAAQREALDEIRTATKVADDIADDRAS